MSCLALGDLQPLTLPVDRVEGESRDFRSAQAVGHEQQQNREITLADRSSAVDDFEQALHLFPRDRARNVRESIDTGTLHAGAEVMRQHPFAMQVAQEHAHVTTQPAHRTLGECAPGIGGEGAEHRRRQGAELMQVDPFEIGLEATQVVSIELNRRLLESAFVAQVIEESGGGLDRTVSVVVYGAVVRTPG